MKRIKVIDIVTAIDGDSLFTACGLGLDECSNIQPCPMHNKFVIIRKQIKKMLDTTSIYELALGLKSEKSILVR
jgi:DNA-binding IscR family transcriptional regulator